MATPSKPSRTIRAAGLAGVAVALVATAAAAAGETAKRRRGKVVRVERGRGEAARLPRICSIDQTATISCFSQPPRVGEVGAVITDTGRVATVAVRTVQAHTDSCGHSTWSGTAEIRSGGLDQVLYSQSYLVLDWPATPQSKLINYPAAPVGVGRGPNIETMYVGIDDDGDSVPDFMAGYYMCDPSGNPNQGYSGYGGGYTYCMTYYQREGGRYRELRVDVVQQC
jgi:hypothetical protein